MFDSPLERAERRQAFLKQVEGLVCKARQGLYGDAEDNFADIAAIWSILLKGKLREPLNAKDVGYLMVAMKLARTMQSPNHLDHALDIAGYATCVGGILLRETPPPDELCIAIPVPTGPDDAQPRDAAGP